VGVGKDGHVHEGCKCHVLEVTNDREKFRHVNRCNDGIAKNVSVSRSISILITPRSMQ